MGLTISRKTAKNLAVRRKNKRNLTISHKKMLTVKNLITKSRLEESAQCRNVAVLTCDKLCDVLSISN